MTLNNPPEAADIAKLAASLTEAQRADILDSTEGFFWTADGRTLRGLERRGIVEHSFRCRARWTDLGLAVRTHLLTVKP